MRIIAIIAAMVAMPLQPHGIPHMCGVVHMHNGVDKVVCLKSPPNSFTPPPVA